MLKLKTLKNWDVLIEYEKMGHVTGGSDSGSNSSAGASSNSMEYYWTHAQGNCYTQDTRAWDSCS